MAENRLMGPVIGVCFDGAGYGDDGAVWGGEVLVGGYAARRGAALHLAYVAACPAATAPCASPGAWRSRMCGPRVCRRSA